MIDSCGTHEPWDLDDVGVKLILTSTVLGQSVPNRVTVPMQLLDAENLYDLRQLGGPAAYSLMPEDKSLWPVLDTWNYAIYDENGDRVQLATPTVALRKELMGY